jgi:hypothetical protein
MPLSPLGRLLESASGPPTGNKMWFRWSIPSRINSEKEIMADHIEATSTSHAREEIRRHYGDEHSSRAKIEPAPDYTPEPVKA